MIITISGTPGSGKSTVGKMLAKKLRYKYYSIGAMRRAMAVERGMTLQEFNVLGESKAFTDRDIDAWQADLGRKKDNMVVEGRTSFHFIPHSVKVFIKANLTEAAGRIFHDKAHVRRFEASHHYHTVKELEHGLRGRIASDARRYKKYYGLNIFSPKHYDLVIDSTKQSPAVMLRQILKKLPKISQKKTVGDRMGTKSGVAPKKRTSKKNQKKVQKRAKVS